MNTKKWISIGTVLGETNIDHFYFSLKNYKAKKGDIITTESKIPSSEGNIVPVTVWGKISSIESSVFVFFPGRGGVSGLGFPSVGLYLIHN